MTREFIIENLNARGIPAMSVDTVKNGIKFDGICVGKGRLRLNVYAERYHNFPDSEIDSVVNEITKSIDEYTSDKTIHDMSLDSLGDWSWAKKRLFLCLQRAEDKNICSRSFLDMVQYVRVRIDGLEDRFGSFAVTPDALKIWGITEDELFRTAKENSRSTVTIEDIDDVFRKMGVPESEIREIRGQAPPMYIIKSKPIFYGAAGIVHEEFIKEVAEKCNSDLVVFPSSVCECLLHPLGNEFERISGYDTLVAQANSISVPPENRLSSHAYYYSKDKEKLYENSGAYIIDNIDRVLDAIGEDGNIQLRELITKNPDQASKIVHKAFNGEEIEQEQDGSELVD